MRVNYMHDVVLYTYLQNGFEGRQRQRMKETLTSCHLHAVSWGNCISSTIPMKML
jgi:hypothetical protein